MADGVVLVVHGGKSSRAVVRRAKQQLLDVGAHLFVVLNNVKLETQDYYSGYYSSYYSDTDADAGDEATGQSSHSLVRHDAQQLFWSALPTSGRAPRHSFSTPLIKPRNR